MNKVGRKAKIEGQSKIIPIYTKVSAKDFERIEGMAKYLNLPKMTLIRSLVLKSLDDIEKGISLVN